VDNLEPLATRIWLRLWQPPEHHQRQKASSGKVTDPSMMLSRMSCHTIEDGWLSHPGTIT
jgi:hypothetical protein